MPGEDHLAARARVAQSAAPEGKADAGARDVATGDTAGSASPRSLLIWVNRPAAAALIATLLALGFTLARWQT